MAVWVLLGMLTVHVIVCLAFHDVVYSSQYPTWCTIWIQSRALPCPLNQNVVPLRYNTAGARFVSRLVTSFANEHVSCSARFVLSIAKYIVLIKYSKHRYYS